MSKRSLRFHDVTELPPGMRRLLLEQKPELLGIDRAPDGTTTAVYGVRTPDQMLLTSVDTIAPKPSKYRNQVTVVDGIRFDSKREAGFYQELKVRRAAGEIQFFLRQVPLHLPGGTRYIVDFMVVEADGRLRWIDVKGIETQVFKVKKREIEAAYPIRIEVVR